MEKLHFLKRGLMEGYDLHLKEILAREFKKSL
jgi:hypothetical protein